MNLVILLGGLLVQRGQPRRAERRLTGFSLCLRRADASRSGEQAIDQPQQISREPGEKAVHRHSDFRLDGKHDLGLSYRLSQCGVRRAWR